MPAPPRRTAGGNSSVPASNERNEYIPSFITKKPFFIPDDGSTAASSGDYLEHQRLQKGGEAEVKLEDRRKRVIGTATKYRKGACANCGGMGHGPKECLSRPRRAGARWTGRDIAADVERDGKVETSWDAKRDAYATYDPLEYRAVIDDYERAEAARVAARREKEAGGESGREGGGADADADADGVAGAGASVAGTKYEEEADMGRNQPTSTRNLRIREDVAPYLRSLDPDSAEYDPKTRRMVDGGALADGAAELVAEQGFMRASGAREEFERAQRLAWESQGGAIAGGLGGGAAVGPGAGVLAPGRIHLQANPTQAQMLLAKRDKDDKEGRERRRRELLAEYGGEAHFVSPILGAGEGEGGADAGAGDGEGGEEGGKGGERPAFLTGITATEAFTEYDPVTGLPKEKDGDGGDGDGQGSAAGKTRGLTRRSKYAEDVRPNNHTAVWGSWWDAFVWGYACCCSTVKNSFCTGDAGRAAWAEEKRRREGLDVDDVDNVEESGGGGDGEGGGKEKERAGAGKRPAEEQLREEGRRKRAAAEEDHERMMDEYRREQALGDDPLMQARRRER